MSEITKAIQHICEEKGLSADSVLETIETALAAAYRKDFGNKMQNVQVKFDPESGEMEVWDEKVVVEDADVEVQEAEFAAYLERKIAAEAAGEEFTEEEPVRFNPKMEMMIKDAVLAKKDAELGEILHLPLEVPSAFGRMAAQTAKQVIIQKLREAERENIFAEFKDKEGTMTTGTVQRREMRGMLIDFGKISGILPVDQQIRGERYIPGQRIKVYILAVQLGTRGPEIILSRSHTDIVKHVFETEIPEIASGAVVIKGIARDAGMRSKVAVATDDESIDPIGSCIGQRGSRIQVIIDELGGEKIDIIAFDEDAKAYISHALSPAKVVSVELNEAEKVATVSVGGDQFSLAIGRGGQNVRLAAALTGWKINVVQEGGEEAFSSEEGEEKVESEEAAPAEESAEEEKSEDASASKEVKSE